MSLKFRKRVEDFTCEHCDKHIKGNGFTNHCPYCLWSKHVDNNPGDREAACNGLMEPIMCEQGKGKFIIIHKCVICETIKRNGMSQYDDFDVAMAIVKKANSKLTL